MERDMLTIGTGSLLNADVDVLVNTVNTVGVMGKGLALQFRRAYPVMFKEYERAAKAGRLQLGKMHVWATGAMTGPRYIVNFPTKGHWKSKSRLADVEAGLDDLRTVLRELGVRSVAVPPLGCGNGGLNWSDVEPLIRQAFVSAPDLDVILFPPAPAPAAAEMPIRSAKPPLSLGRAALIELLDKYEVHSLETSQIEIQKLMYFLQLAGEPLGLQFEKAIYGPYADRLRQVLSDIEGHYAVGFGDGSARIRAAEPLRLLPGAVREAEEVLAEHAETVARIDDVLDLVEGYESMYGLELLASVHWIAASDPAAEPADIVREIRSWTDRKRRLFTPEHVTRALAALRDRGWLAA